MHWLVSTSPFLPFRQPGRMSALNPLAAFTDDLVDKDEIAGGGRMDLFIRNLAGLFITLSP
jgi:hypothetical protein